MNTPQDSMVEQLCALYAERETLDARFPGMSVHDIVEALTGVLPSDAPDRLRSSEATDSLEAQLIELYADKQVLAEAFPGVDVRDIADAFPGLPLKAAA